MNPNNTAIAILKQSIERKMVSMEDLKTSLNHIRKADRETQATLNTVKRHYMEEVNQLAIISKIEGVVIDWHALGETCDDDSCQECCPHDERENGYCIGCDHDGNDGSDVDSAYERVRGI
jgi:hypothetical protein